MEKERLKDIVKRRVDGFTIIAVGCFALLAGLAWIGEAWCILPGFGVLIFGLGAVHAIGDMCIEQAALLDELETAASAALRGEHE